MTELSSKQVREAILAYMNDGHPVIEANQQLFGALAEILGVDLRAGTLREQVVTEDRFTGKVRRGLARLADDTALAKDATVRPAQYLTPPAYQARQQQRQLQEAEKQAAREHALRLQHRIEKLGISEVNCTTHNRIILDLDAAEALVELAAYGWSVRKIQEQ